MSVAIAAKSGVAIGSVSVTFSRMAISETILPVASAEVSLNHRSQRSSSLT